MGKRQRIAKRAKKSRVRSQQTSGVRPSVSFDKPEINSRIQFTIVPHFPSDDPREQIPRLPEGSSGMYRVTFVLSVPGKDIFRDNLDFGLIMKSGDSLLHISPNTHLKVTLSNGNSSAEILFSSNAQGQIATAQMRVDAQNFVEAERTAYDLVAPQLSYWSYLYDVAIDIAGYEVIEEKTESAKYSFGSLGRVKPFDRNEEFKSLLTYRRFFAAYREGMNATNVFYQALSFFKVAEGVRAERVREARRKGTLKKGEVPMYPSEKFPDDLNALPLTDELSKAAFIPYLGNDFDSVLEQSKELIRNAIAHLSQLDAVLDADKYDDVAVCLRAIPVLRYIAHQLLENDLKAAGPERIIASYEAAPNNSFNPPR